MDNQTNSLESLFERAGDYFETRIELFKLKFVDKSSDVISSVAASLTFVFIVVISIVILSIGLAFWVGDFFKKSYYGFFIVGGFYMITGLIFYGFRKKWLKLPLANLFIHKMLN